MEDDFDDFFDSPRQTHIEKKSSKSRYTVDRKECTGSEDLSSNKKECRKAVGKPPTHPNSRPVSASRKSPAVFERNVTGDSDVHRSRRVIEAKIPCEVGKQDYGDGSCSDDDSFIADGDEISDGRRSPIPSTVNSGQRTFSKDVSRYVDGSLVTENNGQDLSDYSGSFSDDTTDDDDEIPDVSPLNTPHSPNGPMISPCSSSVGRTIAKSSNNKPVGLLHADRDSLDLDMLLQTVLHMEKQGRPQSRQAQTPSLSSRQNYSFTNERVQAIDKENHRLMTTIMKHANATKKAKSKTSKLSSAAAGVGTKTLSSAAVNRAKQQQKIEAENLMFLRRLQQTRPTKELRRDVLLGSQSAGRSSSRPMSAGHASSRQRPSSGRRTRLTSECTAVEHYQCTSRPATAFPSQPDDDDILTWQPEDF